MEVELKEKIKPSAGDIVVAKMIKKLRRDREVSQEVLAASIDQGRNVLGRIELGQRQVTLSELHRICDLLEISLAEFVAEYLQNVGKATPKLIE